MGSRQSRKPYLTDLNDSEWQLLAPLIPAARFGGRPEAYRKREIVNAILYVLRTGCAWRFVPNDLPPWGIVYHYFWRWRKDGPGNGPMIPCAVPSESWKAATADQRSHTPSTQ